MTYSVLLFCKDSRRSSFDVLCADTTTNTSKKVPTSSFLINLLCALWLQLVRPHDDSCRLTERICKCNNVGHGEQESCEGIASASCGCCCDKTANKDHLGDADVENQNAGKVPAAKLARTPITIPPAFTCMKHADSYDSAETNKTTVALNDSSYCEGSDGDVDRECPICMDEFHVRDVVSWSSYETCSHVYHHQCIKEWLLRHSTCPICREVFLPVDQPKVNMTLKMFKELSDVRVQRAQRTYYCVRDGLVALKNLPAKSKTKYRKSAATSGTTGATTEILEVTTTAPFTIAPFQNTQGVSTSQGDILCVKEKLRAGITKAEFRKLRGDPTRKKNVEKLEIMEHAEYEASATRVEVGPRVSS